MTQTTMSRQEQAEALIVTMDAVQVELEQTSHWRLGASCAAELEMLKSDIEVLGYEVKRVPTGWALVEPVVVEATCTASAPTEETIVKQTTTKSRKQTETTAATINRVVSKSGEFLGYLVKSDSSEEYYQVTWNDKAARFECNCKATKPCKHIRAVQEVCQARKELAGRKLLVEAVAVVAQEDRRPEAERILLMLDAVSQEMDAATDEESYESAKRIFIALKEDLTEMGYPPMMTVRGWAINAPSRYDKPLRGSGATGFRHAEIARKLAA